MEDSPDRPSTLASSKNEKDKKRLKSKTADTIKRKLQEDEEAGDDDQIDFAGPKKSKFADEDAVVGIAYEDEGRGTRCTSNKQNVLLSQARLAQCVGLYTDLCCKWSRLMDG